MKKAISPKFRINTLSRSGPENSRGESCVPKEAIGTKLRVKFSPGADKG
jgi:hypothetical protein